jgi:hypothetical protein
LLDTLAFARLDQRSTFLISGYRNLGHFEPAGPNRWQPTAFAAGPFAGLQGGAVASLLTAEVEALAEKRKWGTATASSAWFLRPTPMTELRTELSVLTEGGRVSVIDNTLWPANEDQPCATVRVTLSRERGVEVPALPSPRAKPPIPPGFQCAQGGRHMAGPGSWMPWRPAKVTASPGFA